MIIQCEKCQTKFRLDDSKVTVKGVKVRCAKCKHVFSVQKRTEEVDETPVAAVDTPSFDTDQDESFSQEMFSDVSENTPFVSAESENSIFPSVATYSGSAETAPFDASAISFDTDELADEAPSAVAAVRTDTAGGGEVDFSSFDFGDSEPATAPAATNVAPPPAAAAPKKEPQGLDFSDDDMFGAVVESAPEPSTDNISFDFGEDSFAESMDTGAHDSASKGGSLFSLDSPADAPFSLGEIDFGDELTSVAVQQVNPEDLKPSQEILFAPLAAAQPAAGSEAGEFVSDEELPPLSISSRRKQSPLFTGLIAVVALLVVIILGYFGYSSFTTPKDAAAPEAGKISVKGVKAAFVDNDSVGELLVISGEALNEFKQPRAALQVKVTVFDATGQSVATKSAYGGNPLTEEQLASLTLEKIEAAMANQFGDSLANMEVPPGKVIPFVVVLANLPKGAKDFVVQSAGSTVATAKQQ